jgi:integrase
MVRRDLAAVAIMLLAGLRVSEVVNLRLSDVDLDGNKPLLRIVRSKGLRSREVPCVPRLAAILRDYLVGARGHLLGGASSE